MKLILLFFLILNLSALLLTKSKSGLLGMLLQLLIIMNFTRTRDRKSFLAALLILIIFISLIAVYFAIFVPQQTSLSSIVESAFGSFSGRVSLWKTALRMFSENPFLGFGAYAYRSGIYKYQVDGFYSTNAHSTFVQAFAEMGIIGGIGILALFLYLVLKCCVANKKVSISKFIGFGIVGFFFMNIFDSILYLQLPGYLFAVLIGIAYAEVDVPIITHRDFPRNAFIILFIILLFISILVASAYFLYLAGKGQIAKDYKKSINYLYLSTIFNPVEAEYHRSLAAAYTAESFTNKSFRYLRIVEMRRAIFLDPYNPVHYFELGYFYETEGQFQLAAYFYSKASEVAPIQPYFLYQLGRLYLDNLRIEEAKRYLVRAVSLEKYFDRKYVFQSYRPGNIISENDPYLAMANASYLLGNISLSNQKPEVAVAHYTKALSLFPNLTMAYAGRASAYLRLKNFKQAESDARRAIEMDPQNPDYFYLAALSSYNLGNLETAILYLNHCLELDPDHEAAVRLKEEIEHRGKKKE
jgi:tetratricopeptide (TPR) repeat protein